MAGSSRPGETHLDDTERLFLATDPHPTDAGALRQTLVRHSLQPPALEVPIILIDAELDPLILDVCLPGLAIHRIDVEPQAEVLQLVDRTLSSAFLLAHADARKHRDTVLDHVEDEVRRADGGGVLVVAASKVLEALHDDEGTRGSGPERLLLPLRRAAPRWFGGKLRGVDDFKHYSTAVIIGRLEQSPATISRLARCLFATGPRRSFGRRQPRRQRTGRPIRHRLEATASRIGRSISPAEGSRISFAPAPTRTDRDKRWRPSCARRRRPRPSPGCGSSTRRG